MIIISIWLRPSHVHVSVSYARELRASLYDVLKARELQFVTQLSRILKVSSPQLVIEFRSISGSKSWGHFNGMWSTMHTRVRTLLMIYSSSTGKIYFVSYAR